MQSTGKPFTSVDRFDLSIGAAILALLAMIGIVIVRGNQIPTSGIVYLGPVDSIVQNLYLVDPSSSNNTPLKLTNSQDGIISYDVAPNRSAVVYEELQPQGTSSLFLWEASSGTSRLLYECKDAVCSAPSWRPDGGAIAFERSDLNTGSGMASGAPRVWVLDLATNTARPLFSDSQKLGYSPRWSPDGKRAAVFSVTAGGIVIHDFASGKDTLIESVQGEVGDFSPDGKRLFFPKVLQLPDKRFVTHLVLVDVSSDPFVQHDLVPDTDPSDDVGAMWLPDSQSMIVLRRPSGPDGMTRAQLHRVEIATGKAMPLTDDQTYGQSNLTLNPAGDSVLFQRFPLGQPGARPEIWTYRLANGELRRVVVNGSLPNWLR